MGSTDEEVTAVFHTFGFLLPYSCYKSVTNFDCTITAHKFFIDSARNLKT